MKFHRFLSLVVLMGAMVFFDESVAGANSHRSLAQKIPVQHQLASKKVQKSPKMKPNRPQNLNNRLQPNARLPRFRYVTSFPDTFRGSRFPQSLNLSPNEKTLYLGFDSYAPDGSKLIRYNLKRHHFTVGRTFAGGHAQGAALNPRTDRFWFINRASDNLGDDHAGRIKRGSFVEVSAKNLRPVYRRRFSLKYGHLGNTLTFSRNGAWIAVKSFDRHSPEKQALVFYHTPTLSRRGFHWQLMNPIFVNTYRGMILECLAYNPRNDHLYVESELPNRLWSLPTKKLLNHTLTARDVRVAKIPFHIEPEGMAFTKHGSVYMMFGGSNPWRGLIEKSTRPLNF